MWFGANMAGRRNKNAFKFFLQLLILSQILGVKNVVWGGLEVVWGVSTDPSGGGKPVQFIVPTQTIVTSL